MKLNPCRRCKGSDVRQGNGFYYCYLCDCHECLGIREPIQGLSRKQAADVWNKANPDVGALQQALAWALMYRYGSNRAIWRNDVKLGYDRDCVDLLITQGVLIETDGRITIK